MLKGEPASGVRLPFELLITQPVMFNTEAADRILAALQVFPPDNPWNEDISKLQVASLAAQPWFVPDTTRLDDQQIRTLLWPGWEFSAAGDLVLAVGPAADGNPLYTYAEDSMRGDVKGNDVGSVWHVVR